MRLTRPRLVGLVVAMLALLGTACQPRPKPQMELTVRINPTGYVDILTNRITIAVSVSCTRETSVALMPSVDLAAAIDVPLVRADAVQTIHCDGPQIGNWTPTKWRIPDPYPPAPPSDLLVRMSAKTVDVLLINRDEATATETVALTPILCWPGFPTCSPA